MTKFFEFAERSRLTEELFACNMCGYCVPVCPTYQEIGWESTTARGKFYFMKNIVNQTPLGLVERLMKQPTVLGKKGGVPTGATKDFVKAVFECTGCGACEAVCHADIPFDGVWDGIKGWIVDEGLGPLPEHVKNFENVKRRKNLYARDNETRDAWFEEAGVVQSPSPEVLFWVGCNASFEKNSIARAVVKILNAANVRYRVLGREEWCSGGPIARTGYEKYVKTELMPHNIEAVAGTGAKALVTACAECYRAFAKDYKRYGSNPPFAVMHVSHFIEKMIREKRLKFTKKLDRKIAFHDACQLGRVCGETEAPRTAMKYLQGVVPLEMYHSREATMCTGAHGGFLEAYPQEAARLASRRLAEAKDTGASTMVTTCPHAEAHCNNVAKRGNGIETIDLAELAAEHL